jgi:ankyrin repeat protein
MAHLRYLGFGGVASALRRTAAHLPSTAAGAAQPLSAARLPAARGIAVAAALPPPALARRRPLSTGAVGTGLGSADHVVERPMHHAVFFGDMNALQAAILENLRFIEERDNHGCTPLVLAIIRKNVPALQLLLKHGASPNAMAIFVKERLPLHFAVEQHGSEACVPMLRALLEGGADLAEADAEGDTPLVFALKIGAWEAAEELAAAGAPHSGEGGLLQHAVAAGSGAAEDAEDAPEGVGVALLLRHGCPPAVQDGAGFTALHVACLMGHATTARLLLQAGAPSDGPPNGRLNTPLHEAATRGSASCADQLLGAGCAVDPANEEGMTPLHVAAQRDAAEVAELLLQGGACADAQTANKHKPAHLAALADAAGTMEALLRHDSVAEGSVHFASAAAAEKVLRVLLAEGVGAGVDATALFEGQPAPFFATLALQQAIEDDDAEDIERARACLVLLREAGCDITPFVDLPEDEEGR